ncbi:hypothetical protein EKO04_009281 [Ascochyta lentis]|uniref:Repressor of RNA polymerase III transcription MAF1 n=1 Tax=Ascochyta lentis TaxID=205686 RepID=A0A8H7IXZ0_9PLEO|nr:hypothetical protein EKO04_009281 [Ascochyta lentis]
MHSIVAELFKSSLSGNQCYCPALHVLAAPAMASATITTTHRLSPSHSDRHHMSLVDETALSVVLGPITALALPSQHPNTALCDDACDDVTNPSDPQYLDLCALHEVNLALNFDTQDTAIIGGCDLWTVKAAGSDKKLYKRIENTLEARHKDHLTAIADLSEQSAAQFADDIDVERDTPFGSFNEASNRHSFAYLIATLNATHIDYDFANTLNPDEFRRETQHSFMHKIDQTMYYLRPQVYSAGLPAGAVTPLGSPIWSPRSWQLLDSEMDMANCEYYAWEPSDDPFADDGAIWSHHFFLYNRDRKRVGYFYLRGISALSPSPSMSMSLMSKFKQSNFESSTNAGSRKRAEYWLGDRARKGLEAYGDSDELDNMVIDHPGDVVDADQDRFVPIREMSMDADYYESEGDSDVESLVEMHKRKRSGVRTMSEGIMDRMEL